MNFSFLITRNEKFFKQVVSIFLHVFTTSSSKSTSSEILQKCQSSTVIVGIFSINIKSFHLSLKLK